jgi:hypothetical protein
MKVKDLLLIALVCANMTLAAVGLTMYVAKSEPAAQATATNRAGDYVMLSGPVTNSRESLMVIDVVAKRANLYMPRAAVGPAGGTLWDLTDSRSLASDFAQASKAP